jgi:hypothetical protein
MKVGDLVTNTRASLGIPKGSVGLITNKQKSASANYYVYEIQWLGRRMSHSRRMARDLEVIE